VYTDAVQWKRVRDLILLRGEKKIVVCEKENISPNTLRKMLAYEMPPGIRITKVAKKRPRVHNDMVEKKIAENHKLPVNLKLSTTEIFRQVKKEGFKGTVSSVFYHRQLYENSDEMHLWRTIQHIVRATSNEEGASFLSSLFPEGILTGSGCAALERRHKIHTKSRALAQSHISQECWARAGWDKWLSELENKGKYESKLFSERDSRYLVSKLLPENKIDRKKALVLLAQDQDIPLKYITKFLGISLRSAYRYIRADKLRGVEGPFSYRPRLKKKDNDALKKVVFTLLHEPPSLSGVNRTSWRMIDLESVLKEKGFAASYLVLHKIIKEAGFRWKSARKVLTSHDPNYRQKLKHIQNILSNLKDNERFFSIDEFGPFSVKMQMGRSLSPPDVQPIVPQFQRSKGTLICTAALELSRNQVTHFFSSEKNSAEMIKLAEALIEKYSSTNKLYFSWDAASWHKSRSLLRFVKEHNAATPSTHLPLIEIVPLPASAQFLNIIESVFSGMARAIIHNSNYDCKEDAMHAIDLYFEERNQHYFNHPKVAGKKIWGLERTSNQFAPENNCKNPDYR